ncbi:MAG: ExbD/TolR family protein [Granulosicoccus sp.]
MNLNLATKRRRSVISLTPLIDVVFILLLFFMLASNFSQERSLSLISQSHSSSAVVDTEIVRASVRFEQVNDILLDGIRYDQEGFLDSLSVRLKDNTGLLVSISVSDTVDVQSLLDLISTMKSIGVMKISMDGSAP